MPRTNITKRDRGREVFEIAEVRRGRLKSVKHGADGKVAFAAASTATASVKSASATAAFSTSATLGITAGDGRNYVKGVLSIAHTGTKKLKVTANIKTLAGTKSLVKLSTAATTKTKAFTKTLPIGRPGTVIMKGAPTAGTMKATVIVKSISVNSLMTVLA